MTVASTGFRRGDTFSPALVSWVMDPEALGFLLEAIATATEVVADLETTGLDEHAYNGGPFNGGVGARVALASLTLPQPDDVGDPTTWVVPLSHPESPLLGQWRSAFRKIAEAIADNEKPLINQNVRFDARWILALTGVDLARRIVWDTMIASHLLDENSSSKLKERAPDTFGIDRWDDFDFEEPGAAEKVPLIDLGLYAARDTYWTWRLKNHQRELLYLEGDDEPETDDEIENARLGRLAVWTAMPATATLTAIEQRGIGLDRDWVHDRLNEYTSELKTKSAELASRYSEMEPEGVSWAPTSHWFIRWSEAAVRAGDLRIASLTKTGKPQWSKGVLTRQARSGSATARDLLVVRDRLKRTEFLNSWLGYTKPNGRIYAHYHDGRVVTGRLSCVAPDTLIDMPRDMTKYPLGVPISEVKPGDWVYSFDYNMELTLRQVEWVGPTKIAKTIYVTFENSEGERRVLQCTPDHLVRLYNGDWRHAAYLLKNTGRYGGGTTSTRVLGMVKRSWKNPGLNDNYLQFFPHSNSRHTPPSVNEGARYGESSGGKNTEHRWVMERVLGKKLSTKWDVNHKDGNKVNNHPSNLEYLPASEHRSNTHRDGTWGKEQPWADAFVGKTDFRAVSIEEGPTIEVWDMTVPVDHQFIANGIVVHNSSGPNMQQVTKTLRPAFIPRPGYVLIDADYSQIELRVAAFISRCYPMIEAFERGEDLHRLLASRIASKEPVDVTDQERQAGKSANFGLIYGMGAYGFREYAETTYGVSFTEEEALGIHRIYFETWDGLSQWHASTISKLHQTGQVVSPIGRVRRLPGVWDGNEKLVSYCERAGINSPVQGFASDLMQMAAASIEGLLPGSTPVRGAGLVATVHDSIVSEAPEDDWERVAREIQHRMVNIVDILPRLGCRFDVPLAADISVGTRWGLSDVGKL